MHNFKTIKDSKTLILQIKLFESRFFFFKISRPYQRASWLGWVGLSRVVLGRLIVLDDSASSKMIVKMYFNFYLFFISFRAV